VNAYYSRILRAGCDSITSLERAEPPGVRFGDWMCAVNLTLLAYVESFGECDLSVMRQINGELPARFQEPIRAETLTGFWDRLETLGPRSRQFTERHRSELLEYLGSPIRLDAHGSGSRS
jgi:hypothetical protein